MSFPIDPYLTRLQLVNLNYWYANCKCDCKSCYEMRKSINKQLASESNDCQGRTLIRLTILEEEE
jgi:hypothetical protein